MKTLIKHHCVIDELIVASKHTAPFTGYRYLDRVDSEFVAIWQFKSYLGTPNWSSYNPIKVLAVLSKSKEFYREYRKADLDDGALAAHI